MDATIDSFRSIDALRDGWTKTKANLTPFLMLGAVGAFLALLHQALSSPGHEGMGNLLALVVQVLQALLTMVYMRSALTLEGGQPLSLTPRAELFADFFGYLLTSIAYGLIVAFGFVLLIVPGVIWALTFGFATFLAVDGKLDPIAALRESARLTRGVKGRLFQFGLLMLGVNILGALALGVGLLVTVPTTMIAAVHVLRRLQTRSQLPALPVPAPPAPSGHTPTQAPAA